MNLMKRYHINWYQKFGARAFSFLFFENRKLVTHSKIKLFIYITKKKLH